MELFIVFPVIVSAVLLYFLPWIIAMRRCHPNRVAICIVNCFFGWIGVGWIIALIWACLAIDRDRNIVSY